jgi:putative transposase
LPVAQRREAVLSLLRREEAAVIARRFVDFLRDGYSHVRIRYRTPQQLGLLERFHQTHNSEEVYWRLYEGPQHARLCLAGAFQHRT